MARRRSASYPPSWGAWTAPANTNLSASATSCPAYSSHNSTGTYAPALGAGAPCYSEVLFTVNATTQFGQNVYLAGNVTRLGGRLNDPGAVILPLNAGNYTWERPEWFVDIWLQAGQTVEYQYVLQSGDDYVFEQRAPRIVRTAACGSARVETDDAATF